MSYFRTISSALTTTWKGLSLTLRHLLGARKSRRLHSVEQGRYFSEPDGIFTMSFPEERMQVPTAGRYTLDCEIDDCIVCDKCARICPVDCIDIVPVKSAEVIGTTSDGTAKRLYAAKFDIDMSKCCFCGLCTTVCPTECLTMTDDYTHSVDDTQEMVFPSATMSTEEARQKQLEYDQAQAAKLAAKASTAPASPSPAPSSETGEAPKPAAKPQFRPVIKPKIPGASPTPKPEEAATQDSASSSEEPKAESPETSAAPKPAPYKPYLRKPNPPASDAGPEAPSEG